MKTRHWRVLRLVPLFACVASFAGCGGSPWQRAQLVGSGAACAQAGRTPLGWTPVPSLALNAAGEALVAWNHCDGAVRDIVAARFDGSRWEPVQSLSSGPIDVSAQVVLAPNGDGYAVWSKPDGVDAFGSTFDPESGWAPTEVFGAGGAQTRLLADAQGTPIAVWQNARPSDVGPLVIGARRRVSGAWSSAERLRENDVPAGPVRTGFAVAGSAGVLAVWSAGGDVAWSRLRADDGWTSPQPVLADPNLTVASGGDILAVWATRDHAVLSNRFRDGGWGAPEVVSPPGGTQAPMLPVGSLDDEGRRIVLWVSQETVIPSLQASAFVSGSWTAPFLLGRALPGDARIVSDGVGGAIATWTEATDNGGNGGIRAARFLAATGWTVPELLAEGTGQPQVGALASDGAGGAMLVWSSRRGETYEIWSRRFSK